MSSAFSQAWPAFALVAGLLLIGAAAAREGLFAAAGAFVAAAPGGAGTLLVGLLVVEAAVTAVLNLDTAVVFMTPVLLHAARRRGLPDAPFLYGAIFMANAASLLLPGSNLTNLIVLAHERVSGATFAARLALPWITSVAITIAFVGVVFRSDLRRDGRAANERARFRPRLGTLAVVVAATLVLVLAKPALPVLALGLATAAFAVPWRGAIRAVNPALLLGVLAAAVLLGALARHVDVDRLVRDTGRWQTAAVAAAAAVLVNNLPAAVMLSAHVPAHPRALLLGLDLGPNLAVSGSLSAIFWLQVARADGARPSIARYTRLGVVLAPLTIAAALLVTTRP
ncbi:MAG TPA: SLC13 family permease [Gaiellaceae bacterium]|nr:SLC13 family permease [Gaiellaceae bacterium]